MLKFCRQGKVLSELYILKEPQNDRDGINAADSFRPECQCQVMKWLLFFITNLSIEGKYEYLA
jgi:hypothetical protein